MTPNEQKIIRNIENRKNEINNDLKQAEANKEKNPVAYGILLGKSIGIGAALHEAYEVINNADLRDPRD